MAALLRSLQLTKTALRTVSTVIRQITLFHLNTLIITWEPVTYSNVVALLGLKRPTLNLLTRFVMSSPELRWDSAHISHYQAMEKPLPSAVKLTPMNKLESKWPQAAHRAPCVSIMRIY